MDASTFQEHYARRSDDRLRALVNEGLGDLVPEALAALEAELTRRGMTELAEAVRLQAGGLPTTDMAAVIDWIRRSACPSCGRTDQLLNACVIHVLETASCVIACPRCLEAAVSRAGSRNTLGCMFAPLGHFFGARGQLRNAEAIAQARSPGPSPALLEHVRRNQATLTVSMRASRGAKTT